MALNRELENTDNLRVAVPEGTESGDFLVLGNAGVPCVALTDRGSDGKATVQTNGVWRLKVTGKNKAGNKKIEAFDRVYVKGEEINVNNEEGKAFGVALEEVASGATTEVLVALGL